MLSSPIPRFHGVFRVGRFVLPCLLGAALSTCDSGDEDKEKSSAANEKAQAEADELLDKAKKLGLEKIDAEGFGKAKKLIEDGLAAIEEGNTKDAKKLRSGVTNLKRLIEDGEKLGKAREKVAAVKAAAGEARKKAEGAKASENAREPYQEAIAALKAAEAKIDGATSARAIDQGINELTKAKDLFEQAGRQAVENQGTRVRYEAEKKEMLKQKELAKEAGAEEKAAAEWLSAGQMEREAEASGATNLSLAVEQMKQATTLYQNALNTLKTADEIAELQKKQEEATKEFDKQHRELELERIKADKEKAELAAKAKIAAAKAKKKAPGKAGEPDEAAPATVVLFEGHNVEDYPQEIDNEDEAFLMEHLAKLSKAGVLTYDPATHGVALNYASGRICQKDLDMGDTPKAHVYFEDPMTKGQKAKTKEEEELMAYYSFSGNTVGTVTFPVPFRYYVRMEFDMGIGTMDSHGTWGTLVMYDKRRGSGYLSEWLRVGTLQGGARKLKEAPNVVTPEGKPVRGSADVWHLKFRAVPYLVEYRMPDPNPKKAAEGPLASGQFSVIYDNYTAEPIPAKTSSKAFQRGLVGFTWNRTKFQIKNLQITGILDKEAAVAYLRELTKIKKSVAKKTTKKKPKAPAAEGETGEGGGNGGGTGDTAEKPKKKKAKSDTGEEGKKEDPFDF